VTVGALAGLSDTLLNLIDVNTVVDLIKAAINVVKAIPKLVRSTKSAVEKYARELSKSQVDEQ
jgi:hypothetical protein